MVKNHVDPQEADDITTTKTKHTKAMCIFYGIYGTVYDFHSNTSQQLHF